MSIADKLTRLSTARDNIITALGNKGVTATGHGFEDFSTDIGTISGGGVTVESLSVTSNGTYTAPTGKAYSPVSVNVSGGSTPTYVKFIDYDGTLLHSYTAAEFAELADLPANPTGHTRLTPQGWNWSKAQITAQLTAMPDQDVIVGQMYTTVSGATEIDITLTDLLEPTLICAVNGTAVINWGDGSNTDTVTGTSLTTYKYTQHNYAAAGDYTIKVSVTSGTMGLLASGSGAAALLMPRIGTTSYSSCLAYSSCIKQVFVGNNVQLRGNALGNMPNCHYITLPSSITFSQTNATTSNMCNSCYSLKSLTIPSGVTTIDTSFMYCYNLTSVSLPYTVTTFNSSFSYGYSLKYITIPNNVTKVGSSCFAYSSFSNIGIPSNITNLDSSAFSNNRSLQKLLIPNTISTLGTGVFQACTALTETNIPTNANFTTIPESTFHTCTSLKSITIPNNITSIGNSAFYNCYVLENLTIPDTVTSIGKSAFYANLRMKTVTIPNTVTSINEGTFQNCYTLSSVTIPNTVTSIGKNAFTNCYVLQSINIPSNVASFGDGAFSNCYALQTINIPSNITSIPASLLSGAKSLRSITIPSAITSIGAKAFYQCISLGEIHFQSTTPPTVDDSNTWSGIPAICKIYVPTGYLSAYTGATNYPSSSTYTYVEE